MPKIYPRLERKKLRRLNSGKRVFKSAEEKEMAHNVWTSKWARERAFISSHGEVLRDYDSQSSDGDFESVSLSFRDISILSMAFSHNELEKVFAAMMEAKAAGVPFDYNPPVSAPSVQIKKPPVEFVTKGGVIAGDAAIAAYLAQAQAGLQWFTI